VILAGVHRFFSWAMVLTSGFTALSGFSSSQLTLQLSRLGGSATDRRHDDDQ